MFGSIKNVHYAVKASFPLTQSRSNGELTFFFPIKHTDKQHKSTNKRQQVTSDKENIKKKKSTC